MKNLNVKNMISNNGNPISNQFIINIGDKKMFQSYETLIAVKEWKPKTMVWQITLDKNSWDYSRTTGKYRNIFLGESKIETEKKIKSKEYKLKNLNK